MELSAKADPGMTTQKTMNEYRVNPTKLTSGPTKNNKQQIRIINTYPNRLHSLVARMSEMIMGMTDMHRTSEFVADVILYPSL